MSVTTAGEEDVDDMNARGKFLTQQHTADSRDLIVLAAAAGDVSTMLQHLRTHPNEVHNYVFMSVLCTVTHTVIFPTMCRLIGWLTVEQLSMRLAGKALLVS